MQTFEAHMLKSVKVFRCLRLDRNGHLTLTEINYYLLGFWPYKIFSHLTLTYF